VAWAAADTARDAPGFYGKLAGLGDFAQRRVPPAWVGHVDAWLSQAMQDLRARLGERWLDAYLTAPLQRFAWAPGVIDTQWWFGVMMPSCDSAGRYFPLVIAQTRAKPPQDRVGLDHLELWYEHLTQAAMRTLHDDEASMQSLESELRVSPPWPSSARGIVLDDLVSAGLERLRLPNSPLLSEWIDAFAALLLTARLHGCSVWWCKGTEHEDDAVDIVPGLPQGEAFARLLARGA